MPSFIVYVIYVCFLENYPQKFKEFRKILTYQLFDILYVWLPFSHVLAPECVHPLIQRYKSWNDFSWRDKRDITWNGSMTLELWGRLMQLSRRPVYSFFIPLYLRTKLLFSTLSSSIASRVRLERLIYKENYTWNKKFR